LGISPRRIQEIVLVGLHERLDELRRDPPDVVTLCSTGSVQEMRPEQASNPTRDLTRLAV
jgi:hypothetical protein